MARRWAAGAGAASARNSTNFALDAFGATTSRAVFGVATRNPQKGGHAEREWVDVHLVDYPHLVSRLLTMIAAVLRRGAPPLSAATPSAGLRLNKKFAGYLLDAGRSSGISLLALTDDVN